MIEILQRMEESRSLDDDWDGDGGDGDDDEEEASPTAIEGKSPDELLAMLTESERAEFERLLQASDDDKLRELLDRELTNEEEDVWWTRTPSDTSSWRPPAVDNSLVPQLPLGSSPPNPTADLVFNILAIVFAYTHTVRTFPSLSSQRPDKDEIEMGLSMLSILVPFLFRRGDKTLLTSTQQAIQYVVERVEGGEIPPQALALLLEDLETIVKPPKVVPLDSTTNLSVSLCLSHIYFLHSSLAALTSDQKPHGGKGKEKHASSQQSSASLKILHHIALIQQSPTCSSDRFRSLAQEVHEYLDEIVATETFNSAVEQGLEQLKLEIGSSGRKDLKPGLIEELE